MTRRSVTRTAAGFRSAGELVALMNVAVKQVLRFAFIVGADYFDMRIVSGTFFPWQMEHILDEGGKFGIGADAVSQMEGQDLWQAFYLLNSGLIHFLRRDHILGITGKDHGLVINCI